MRLSVLEIYLDRVRDLLDPNHGSPAEAKLEVRAQTPHPRRPKGRRVRRPRGTTALFVSARGSPRCHFRNRQNR
jgi:hypothetical protein